MLKKLINQIDISSGVNEVKIDEIEDEIAKGINNFYKDSLFFNLPLHNVISILKKSNIDSVEIICDFLQKASKSKEHEAHFLLHCFDLSELTMDDCVKILSSLNNVPICSKLGSLYSKSRESVDVDWEYETKKRDKQIDELKRDYSTTNIKEIRAPCLLKGKKR